MRVLIACEESQRVCIEMRKLGHEAYSCDIQEPSGGHPEWHIKGDVLRILNPRFYKEFGGIKFQTMDGVQHIVYRWDMIIAHPPCTYLSNVATRSFSLKCTPAEKVIARWEERAKAAVFFMRFALADCQRIAIENPVGFMSTAYRKPDQIISPYQFAESVNDSKNYHTKRTCLWLKGLPLLKTNRLPPPNLKEIYGVYPSGKTPCWEDKIAGKDREKLRSKTFPGIAKAMAEQWAGKA